MYSVLLFEGRFGETPTHLSIGSAEDSVNDSVEIGDLYTSGGPVGTRSVPGFAAAGEGNRLTEAFAVNDDPRAYAFAVEQDADGFINIWLECDTGEPEHAMKDRGAVSSGPSGTMLVHPPAGATECAFRVDADGAWNITAK